MFLLRGVTHNIPLLRDVLTEKTFLSGSFTTSYLPETYPDGFKGTIMSKGNVLVFLINHSRCFFPNSQFITDDIMRLASLAAVVHGKENLRSRNILNEGGVENQVR